MLLANPMEGYAHVKCLELCWISTASFPLKFTDDQTAVRIALIVVGALLLIAAGWCFKRQFWNPDHL